jgi:coenzyme PQQ synthesis protein D (PqqD)
VILAVARLLWRERSHTILTVHAPANVPARTTSDHRPRYVRNPEFVFRRIETEIVLLPVRRNMGDLESIFSLNEVGGRVWELLATPRSLDELRASVVQEFEVTDAEAERDLRAFLDELLSIDAVRTG